MPMNPLPPQAYTKATLVLAYSWLQHQSDKIKEVATTPDVLVSLYLKAKLQGDNALERPSIQNFKNELKSLAGMMGEFEIVETSGPTPSVRMRSHQPEMPTSQSVAAAAASVSAAPSVSAAAQTAAIFLQNLDARSVAVV